MNLSLRLKFGGLLAIVVCWCLFMAYLVPFLEWMPQFQHSSPDNDNNQLEESRPLIQPKSMNINMLPEPIQMIPFKSKTTKNHAMKPVPGHSPVVQVVLAGDTTSLGGLVATINSILSNTKHQVKFHIVIPEEELSHFRTWIHSTKLHTMIYEMHTLATHGNKALMLLKQVKAHISTLFPYLEGRFIYLDNDIIVQGDIWELFSVKIQPRTYGAFAHDCSSSSARTGSGMGRPRYATHVNLHHNRLRDMDIDGAACPFATGVFVANISEWKEADVFERLQDWLNAHKESPITRIQPGIDEVEAAMLIEFYNKVSPLNPLWHVQHLGIGPNSRYSKQFIERAKLLHWSGHFKPWRHWSAHTEHWDRYFIPDPTLQFRPVRKRSG